MLKRITAFVSTLVMAVSLSSCAMTEIPEREVVHNTEVPPKMLFLGDSIAAGYGLDGYTLTDNYNCPDSYANILKERYNAELPADCGHVMVNKAVSGYTSGDLIEQIQSGALDSDLSDSDAVIVSIGGNDLLGIMLDLLNSLGIDDTGSFDTAQFDIFSAASMFMSMDGDVDKALEQFDDNIKVISDELSERTEGTVYIQTLYDPLEYFSKFSMVTDFSAKKIGRLNTMIKDNAPRGYTVIDVAADFKGKAAELTRIADYDIHPNEAGHKVIAEDVDAALRETGFSYTTVEQGEKQLTADGKKAIAAGCGGGAAAVIAAVTVTVLLIRKRRRTTRS